MPGIEQGSILARHHSSRDAALNIEDPVKTCNMIRDDIYLDERQYEVFTVGSLMREAAAEESLYERYFNHSYTYDLITVQELVPDLRAESTFLIHLPVGGILFEKNVLETDPSRNA